MIFGYLNTAHFRILIFKEHLSCVRVGKRVVANRIKSLSFFIWNALQRKRWFYISIYHILGPYMAFLPHSFVVTLIFLYFLLKKISVLIIISELLLRQEFSFHCSYQKLTDRSYWEVQKKQKSSIPENRQKLKIPES